MLKTDVANGEPSRTERATRGPQERCERNSQREFPRDPGGGMRRPTETGQCAHLKYERETDAPRPQPPIDGLCRLWNDRDMSGALSGNFIKPAGVCC